MMSGLTARTICDTALGARSSFAVVVKSPQPRFVAYRRNGENGESGGGQAVEKRPMGDSRHNLETVRPERRAYVQHAVLCAAQLRDKV